MSRSSGARQSADAKRFNGRWLNKRLRKMHISILNFCKKHNHRHARREKTVSRERQHMRYRTLGSMMLEELPALGFEPSRFSVQNYLAHDPSSMASMASFAARSTRSFSSTPLWPLTHSHST